jgi:hypothetical protein
MLLVAVEKGKMFHRVISWKEMYKLAKKGKRMKPEGFLKQAADKMGEMVAAATRSAVESAKLRETLKRGSTDPIPPFMPMPMRTVPMAPQAPIVPPPSASGM